MQLFLISSLVLIVVSIALLFNYFSIVAVNDIALQYLGAALGQLNEQVQQVLLDTVDGIEFVGAALGDDLQYRANNTPAAWAATRSCMVHSLFPGALQVIYAVFNDGSVGGCFSGDNGAFTITKRCKDPAVFNCTLEMFLTTPAGESFFSSNLSATTQYYASLASQRVDPSTNISWTTLTLPNGTLDQLQAFRFSRSFETSSVLGAVVVANISASVFVAALERAQQASEGISVALFQQGLSTPLLQTESAPFLSSSDFVTGDIKLGGVFSLGWEARVEAGGSVVKSFNTATYVVIVVSVIIGIVVSIVGVVALRMLLTPLRFLKDDMVSASSLKFDALRLHTSVLRELNIMYEDFMDMASRLNAYKPFLLEAMNPVRSKSLLSASSTMNGGNSSMTFSLEMFDKLEDSDGLVDEAGDEQASQHLIKVDLSYVSRRTGQIKKAVSFEHQYLDGDDQLKDKFAADCLTNLGLHKFEMVSMEVCSRGVFVKIRTNRQLEEAIATCPGELRVKMKSAVVRKLLSPVSVLVDVANLLINIVIIIFGELSSSPGTAERLSINIFVGLYAFALGVNVMISLWLLKRGKREPKMKDWLAQAGQEVSVMLLICSLNTQHVHFLWSHWSLFGLRFNAPRSFDLWQLCVRWSLFGFFFSDIMQILYKMYRLTDNYSLWVLTAAGLATSVFSIGLSLPKKLSFFAIARGQAPDETFGDEHGALRPRSGLTHALDAVEATIVLFRLLPSASLSSSLRCSVEFTAFYTAVFSVVKSNEGSILHFHADEVQAIFNSPKATQFHAAKALKCVLSCQRALHDLRLSAVASVASDTFVVGYLGSATRKTFQCFGPFDMLQRMNCFAESTRMRVTATRRVMDTVTTYPAAVSKVFKFHAHDVAADDGMYYEVTSATRKHRRIKVPALQKALPFFGVPHDSPDAVDHLRTYCNRWLSSDPLLNEVDSPAKPDGAAADSSSAGAPTTESSHSNPTQQLSATRIVEHMLASPINRQVESADL